MSNRLRRKLALVAVVVCSLWAVFALHTALAAPSKEPAATRTYPGVAPCDTTIQSCINGSNAGDSINIAAGTYTQSFNLNKTVNLLGAGASQTILVAQPYQRVMTVTLGLTQTVVISGLTFAGGNVLTATYPLYPNFGGGALVQSASSGLFVSYDAHAVFNGVAFRDNKAYIAGGLYSTLEVSVTITASQFISNVALDAGGLWIEGHADIDGTDFVGNSSGGALIGRGRVNHSRFERNTSASAGGLSVFYEVALTDTDFISNTGMNGGGANLGGLASLSNVRFLGNRASGLGGAAYFVEGATISNSLAAGNMAADGGAFFFSNISGKALVQNSVLSGNVATTTFGADGIVFGYARAPTQSVDLVANTIITADAAGSGRALVSGLGRALQVSNTTFSGFDTNQVSLGAQALLTTTGLITSGTPITCPSIITHTRLVTVWYGTVYSRGVPLLNRASADSRLSGTPLAFTYYAHSAVTPLLVPWWDAPLADIEWLAEASDNLDAERNLRSLLASPLLPVPAANVRFDAPIDRGTDRYVIASWTTFNNPDCSLQLDNVGLAQIHYFELNARIVEYRYLPVVVR
ncbi:MAG: hypothetical protein HZB53_17710 [Chloroflexi bacterium]|nr:hypothetical protein [Chloroflexota bacterium]